MVGEGLRMLEQGDWKVQAKFDWLRGAATGAFASPDRGEGMRFDSLEALNAYIQEISEEVFGSTFLGDPVVIASVL